MSLDDLYREVILDHYRNPRNKGHLAAPDATAEGVNPLCGDEITIEIAFSDVQESPRYPAGLALRFARVRRYRPDKPASEADTLAAVRAIFERQRA